MAELLFQGAKEKLINYSNEKKKFNLSNNLILILFKIII